MYLFEILKSYFKLGQIHVLCRIVECLVSAIVLQQKGIDFQDKSAAPENGNNQNKKLLTSFQLEDIPEKMLSIFKKLCRLVDKYLDLQLPSSLGYSRITPWNDELQVSCGQDLLRPTLELHAYNVTSRYFCAGEVNL